jgi:hypothetical protein
MKTNLFYLLVLDDNFSTFTKKFYEGQMQGLKHYLISYLPCLPYSNLDTHSNKHNFISSVLLNSQILPNISSFQFSTM